MNLRKKQNGWLLMDVLIGMVVLMVALTALIVAYRQSSLGSLSVRNYNSAIVLAHKTLEELKTQDGQSALALPDDKDTTQNHTAFHISATTSVPVSSSYWNAKIIPVKVTVTWNESPAGAKELHMVNYYYLQ